MDITLRREIEELRGARIAQIRARYREVFEEEPRSKHREQLLRRLVWRLQVGHLIPTTIESGPTSASTRVSRKPAFFIHPVQSAPV